MGEGQKIVKMLSSWQPLHTSEGPPCCKIPDKIAWDGNCQAALPPTRRPVLNTEEGGIAQETERQDERRKPGGSGTVDGRRFIGQSHQVPLSALIGEGIAPTEALNQQMRSNARARDRKVGLERDVWGEGQERRWLGHPYV